MPKPYKDQKYRNKKGTNINVKEEAIDDKEAVNVPILNISTSMINYKNFKVQAFCKIN